jgi:hypothetical protein
VSNRWCYAAIGPHSVGGSEELTAPFFRSQSPPFIDVHGQRSRLHLFSFGVVCLENFLCWSFLHSLFFDDITHPTPTYASFFVFHWPGYTLSFAALGCGCVVTAIFFLPPLLFSSLIPEAGGVFLTRQTSIDVFSCRAFSWFHPIYLLFLVRAVANFFSFGND